MTTAIVEKAIPEGYIQDARGRLVPIEAVDEYDLQRDELVRQVIKRAFELRQALTEFKSWAMGEVQAFVELSAERYDVKVGGAKGNITLRTYDGAYEIKVAIADRLVFDERIHAAKEIIDQLILEWTEGSRKELKALVEHAFQVDAEGKLNLGRVLSLTRLSIEDERWKQAMQAIKDSMQVASSRAYLRVYERQPDGKYNMLPLDISAL